MIFLDIRNNAPYSQYNDTMLQQRQISWNYYLTVCIINV